ncbi:MAG: polysaccharide biosynthesis C-terminal domain-containing protein [Chloroflexota bacterium]|nr:polysaccharide biosynthesis C-terminal domain-containing protein [Chloroflexota bacterium]
MTAGETPRPGRSLAREAATTVGARFLLAAIILATDVVLARTLGADAKGRFTLVLLLSQLSALAIGLGLDRAIGAAAARSVASARASLGNALAWTAVVGGAATLVGLAAAAGAALPNLAATDVFFASLALPLELLISVGLLGLLGRRLVGAYNATRLLRRAVLLVGIGLVGLAGLDLRAALAANLVALIVGLLVVFVAMRRDGVTPSRPQRRLLAGQLRYGIRSWPGSLAERLQFRADLFLVNALVGVTATGVYSVATSVAETLWYIPAALGVVIFSRVAAGGLDAAPLTSAVTRVTLAFGLVVGVAALVVAPIGVEVLYGAPFRDAGPALQLLLPGIVAYGVVSVLSQFLLAAGAPGRSTLVLLAGLTLNLVANALLIPRFGIMGAAMSSSISYTVTALLMVVAFHRLTHQPLRDTLLVRRSDLRRLLDRLGGRSLGSEARGS